MQVVIPMELSQTENTKDGIVMTVTIPDEFLVPVICTQCRTSEVVLDPDFGHSDRLVKANVTIHGYKTVEAYLRIPKGEVSFLTEEHAAEPFVVELQLIDKRLVTAQDIADP